MTTIKNFEPGVISECTNAYQPMFRQIEDFLNTEPLRLVVRDLEQHQVFSLIPEFVEDPTSPEGFAAIVEACAIMYTNTPEQFVPLVKRLLSPNERNSNTRLDDEKIGQLYMSLSKSGSPYSNTAGTLKALHLWRTKAFARVKSETSSADYYNEEFLRELLLNGETVPFGQFVHAFLFTEDDIAALSSTSADMALLEELGLLEIHRNLINLMTREEAFHHLYRDRLVSALIKRFYDNFLLAYVPQYSTVSADDIED